MFTLKIETDNAAFEEDPHAEVARLLRQAADKLDTGPVIHGAPIMDSNGNRVGHWNYTEE